MRFLFHAALAATLIVSDATHAATLGGTRTRAPSASDDDARYRHNEEAWRRIMASICTGCGGPGPKLEIKRKRADITRLERQAGIGAPLSAEPAPAPAKPAATSAASALAQSEPGVAESGSAQPEAVAPNTAEPKAVEPKAVERNGAEAKAPAETATGTAEAKPVPKSAAKAASKPVLKPVLRTAQRGALGTRKAVRLARLRRVREQARLALLERRRQTLRRRQWAQVAPPAPPRRLAEARPSRPVVRRPLGRPLQVSALVPSVQSRSWPLPGLPQRPYRIHVDAREVAFERSRAILCQCTIR